MNAARTRHPARDMLQAFGLGKLDDAATAEVSRHLESCPECKRQVAEVPDDSLLAHLRQANALAATPAPAKDLSSLTQGIQNPPASLAAGAVPAELLNSAQYDIVRPLGGGGMGVVYLARNKWLNRLEVLKVIRTALVDKAGVRERFLREIRAAAALSHDHVVKAHSVLPCGELLVFAMEYVPGEDLAQLVKREGPLPMGEACLYARQVALGLQHAHDQGTVHRDIKPSNLILARAGDRPVVKILDFGLAKASREQAPGRDLTGAGTMLGTPDYMAPEQITDAAAADVRADIYSLGCTLYHLLTGAPPFHADSVFLLLQAHHTTQARPVNVVRPEVPAGLAAVVARMMAKHPVQRYQTPREVAQALAPFVADAESPPALQERVGSRVKQRVSPFVLTGAALVAVLVAAGILVKITLPDGSKQTLELPDGSTVTIKPGPTTVPADAAWLKKVAGMGAVQQVHAVKARLKELNPRFDAEVAPMIVGGVVTGLQFSTEHVRDLSPVRAFPELRELNCSGPWVSGEGKGKLADLSPLQGMKLTVLNCGFTQVADLSPLTDMKLTALECDRTLVADLSPLRNMKLTFLDCTETRVSDLSPLRDMKLTTLICAFTPVSDLSPLRDMKLTNLNFGATQVSDLSPLRGMKLTTLHLAGTRVGDLSPLKDMRLTLLDCRGTPVSDLSPLKDMKLTHLYCKRTQVDDLSLLRGMPLRELVCDFQHPRDGAILRALTTLERINEKTAAEFWKEVDSKKP
jgi:serine/threonine protein kinase